MNALCWPRHSARSEAKSQNLIVILCSVNPTPRIYWRTHDGFCNSGHRRPLYRMTWSTADNEFKDSKFCEIHQLKKNQIFLRTLIADPVILRELKRSRRIYRKNNDGFCNSGQKRPPCRMTRWMADNEFKAPRFCLIRQIQKILRFPYELSLLTNVILREVKRSRRIYWKTIELSFCAEQSEVTESLLYQNISTIPLNRAHELNFQPDF